MFRSTLSKALPARSLAASRSIHTSPAVYKFVTEKVKDAASSVGEKLAKGIEVGEVTGEKIHDATGTAKSKAEEASELAKQKANQASAGTKEAKDDFKKNVK
ncbi:hypothetical protein EW145_g3600 [Phellinidium pouzarii]|uniref:Uncharacterized protein n=1 Tax=Phellinidium pouzarii TaxID=167371 RepID=A0A4S4L8H6_9AGAM|nr:hypothetical protein EW145_g3600 [Phellinidium pouzarii]